MVELKQKEYLKINKLEKEVLSYTDKYNTIVEKGAVECDEIRSASKSLEELSKLYTLYINSTTLKRIIPQRSLWKYFRGVYGEPNSENYRGVYKEIKAYTIGKHKKVDLQIKFEEIYRDSDVWVYTNIQQNPFCCFRANKGLFTKQKGS